MTSPTGRMAFTPSLPVDVLIKSAPVEWNQMYGKIMTDTRVMFDSISGNFTEGTCSAVKHRCT